MKLCAFALAKGRPCTQPALKRSAAGLCRLHADIPQRSQNILRARATQGLLPQRRRVRSEADALRRKRRSFRIPQLDSIRNLKQTLFLVMRGYECGTFDVRAARGIVRCIRLAYINLRFQPGKCGDAAERADFYAHYRAVRDQLRPARTGQGGRADR